MAIDRFSALPDELILSILAQLGHKEVVRLQVTSRGFQKLCLDHELWRIICFEHSRAEERRRREEQQASQPARLAAIRAWASRGQGPLADTSLIPDENSDSTDDVARPNRMSRSRALSNWDPSYLSERLDFKQEFVHRNASISTRWLQDVYDKNGSTKRVKEAIGMGVLRDPATGAATKVIGPLEDGSIAMWDVLPGSDQLQRQGSLIARSLPILAEPGSVSGRGSPTTSAVSIDTPPFDSVSVDQSSGKAYIAVYEQLHEVDVQTLQLVRKQLFPGSITAISSAKSARPLIIGTPNKLYMHDPRLPQDFSATSDFTERCELIAGPRVNLQHNYGRVSSRRNPEALLAQPAPFSIKSLPLWPGDTDENDIWIAGSFTSLLNYDRRFWPKLRGTIFSGARLSGLATIPYPFAGRRPLHEASPNQPESMSGSTLVAVGEYKGKGSLELYGIPFGAPATSHDSPILTRRAFTDLKNRQTASRTRLLSICAHGARLVFSDGDGNLKWVERDGFSVVREYTIDSARTTPTSANTTSSAPPAPSDDIVQKIVPTHGSRAAHNNDDLLLWTGDGRVGLLSFGRTGHAESAYALAEQAEGAREAEAERHEREFGAAMMRELERQADETRWLRGMGLGFQR